MNMKKFFMIALALVMTMPIAMSKTDNGLKPWQAPEIVQENRLPMSATFVTDQQATVSLDGMWKFAGSESLYGRERRLCLERTFRDQPSGCTR